MAIHLFEFLRRLFGMKKAEKIAKKAEKPATPLEKWKAGKGGEYLKMDTHKGWFDGKGAHQKAAKKSWHKRLEHKLDELAEKKKKTAADKKAIKKVQAKLLQLEKELEVLEKNEEKKSKPGTAREKRRKKIRKKLGEKAKIKKEKAEKAKKKIQPPALKKTEEGPGKAAIMQKAPAEQQRPVTEVSKETEIIRPAGERPRHDYYATDHQAQQAKDLDLLERSLWAKQRAEKAGLEGMPSERLREIIKAKSGEGTSPGKIDIAERRVQELMRKYNLNEREIESEIQKMDSNRLLQDFDRLINMIEMDRKERRVTIEDSPEMTETEMSYIDHKKEKTKTVSRDIKKLSIVTDADRIYAYVKSKGKAKTKQIAKDLEIPRKKVDEYAEILAENRLVELKYLPFGGIMLNLREEKK
ncbi:MAG: hypothetical protein V1493_00935 [Candidatus Diapherotrites archaeon]